MFCVMESGGEIVLLVDEEGGLISLDSRDIGSIAPTVAGLSMISSWVGVPPRSSLTGVPSWLSRMLLLGLRAPSEGCKRPLESLEPKLLRRGMFRSKALKPGLTFRKLWIFSSRLDGEGARTAASAFAFAASDPAFATWADGAFSLLALPLGEEAALRREPSSTLLLAGAFRLVLGRAGLWLTGAEVTEEAEETSDAGEFGEQPTSPCMAA